MNINKRPETYLQIGSLIVNLEQLGVTKMKAAEQKKEIQEMKVLTVELETNLVYCFLDRLERELEYYYRMCIVHPVMNKTNSTIIIKLAKNLEFDMLIFFATQIKKELDFRFGNHPPEQQRFRIKDLPISGPFHRRTRTGHIVRTRA